LRRFRALNTETMHRPVAGRQGCEPKVTLPRRRTCPLRALGQSCGEHVQGQSPDRSASGLSGRQERGCALS
jgi:hypothetical protein